MQYAFVDFPSVHPMTLCIHAVEARQLLLIFISVFPNRLVDILIILACLSDIMDLFGSQNQPRRAVYTCHDFND